MPGLGIIGSIIVGIFAGWLAEKVMKSNHGLVTNLIVGLIGGFLGGFIANLLHITYGGWIGNIVFATIGAVLLLAILRMIKRR